jgi:hypothetical protein
MRYTITLDGKYVFPENGKPPTTIPDGYIRDPGNAYVLIPDYKSKCCQRTHRQKVLPCGKLNNVDFCEHYDVIVTPIFCNECDVDLEIKNTIPKEKRL